MTENSVYSGAHLDYERICEEPTAKEVRERAMARQAFCENVLAGNLARGANGYYDFGDLLGIMPEKFQSRYESHADEQLLSMWLSGRLSIWSDDFYKAAMALADTSVGEAL